MRSVRPIPKSKLPETMTVREPLPDGTYGEPRMICNVCFQRTQKVSTDEHRSASVGGKVFIDAVNSAGAFEVQAGSRVTVKGSSLFVLEVHTCCDLFGRVHHWELKVG